VSYTLEKEGIKVLEGINGVDALKHLNGQIINLVITDYHMPEMDGIGLIKEIRKKNEYKYIPILFLTTESKPHYKIEAKEAGATGWIIKPFDPDYLIKIIHKLMQ
jgi:two-component system chemotaxis response regulator CheY